MYPDIPDYASPISVAEQPQMFAAWAWLIIDLGAVLLERRGQSNAKRQLCAKHCIPYIVRMREVVWLDLGLVVDVAGVEADATPTLGVQHICCYCVARLQV